MKGILSLLGAAFVYGFFGILTRIVGFNLPVFYASWTRNLIGIPLLVLLFVLTKSKWQSINHQDALWIILRSLAGIFGYLGSYFSFYYLPIGTALFIFYAAVAIGGYFFGFLLFKEKLTPLKLASLFLAFTGLALIYRVNFDPKNLIYVFMALGAGLGTATWNVFAKKVSGHYSALQLNLIDFVIVFVFDLIVSLVIREKWPVPVFNTVWIASLLFVLMFVITGQLMVIGFKYVEAQIGSLIMLSEILFGIILAYLFFQEAISLFTLGGGLIVILAIALPEIRLIKKG